MMNALSWGECVATDRQDARGAPWFGGRFSWDPSDKLRSTMFIESALFGLLAFFGFALFGTIDRGRVWAEEPPAPLRVATYNIRYDNPKDGPDAWPLRKAGMAQILREHRADVLGLQEVLHRQLQDLRELLPDYDAFGVGRDDGREKGEYSPILYRRDRLRLIAGSTRWLSEQPDQPGSKSWDAAITRIATRCLFEERRTKQWFVVYNTHFDHQGQEARRHSARLLRLWTAQEAAPTFVLGDFNCTRRDAPFQELTATRDGGRLRELRGIEGVRDSGPDSTWNGFKQIDAGQQIDFIFASPPIGAVSYLVDERRLENGRFPSDHLPVIVESSVPARVSGAGMVPDVRAFNVDQSFPLLIRQDWNVLRHVAIEVAQPGPARLATLEFMLTGEALADDLAELRVVLTGERSTAADGPAWGAPRPPAANVKFEGESELKPGRHHAWLLCRLKPTASLEHGAAAICVGATLASGERVAIQGSGQPLAPRRFGVADEDR